MLLTFNYVDTEIRSGLLHLKMFDLSPPGMPKDLGPLIGALDQGTSCTRFLVFVASSGELVRLFRI